MSKDELIEEWLQSHGASTQDENLDYVTVHCKYAREDHHADQSCGWGVPVVNLGATPIYYYVDKNPKNQFSTIEEVIIWLQVNGLRDYDRIVLNMPDDQVSKFIEAWKLLYG